MDPKLVHHIEIWIREDGEEFVTDFCSKFGFRRSAHRKTQYCEQWLVTAGHTVRVLITYATRGLQENQVIPEENQTINNTDGSLYSDLLKNDPYVTWALPNSSPDGHSANLNGPSSSSSSFSKKINPPGSVFNVSLVVNDIQKVVEHLQKCGVCFVRPLRTVSDTHGSVTLTTIRSCVGNVVHTLIDKNNYRGHFLPGFTPITTDEKKNEEEMINNVETNGEGEGKTFVLGDKQHKTSLFFIRFDHVTFAVESGTSACVLQWYERCFGMKRFNVNSGEDQTEGFVINLPGIALRLKAFEYWKCAEVGLRTNNPDGSMNILFVIAESLPGSASNQVDTFLKEHGGPGIQHIGLLTNTMMDTVDWLNGQRVQFVEPPYTYYKEIEPLLKICNLSDSLERLQKLGILIDVEERESEDEQPRYLMQKFTKPLFEDDTFFLEVIQRNGALGFGAANIIALWKSLQSMLDEKTQLPNEI